MNTADSALPSSITPLASGGLLAPLALALLAMTVAACHASSSGSGPRPGAGAGVEAPSALDGSSAPVIDWSLAAYDAFMAQDKYANPLGVARVLAMLHLAQHDALTAIRPTHASHALTESAPDADPVAAASSAAFEVLAAELPGQREALASRLARSLEASPDGAARDRGVALGQRAAAAVLQRRREDGAAGAPVAVPRKLPEGEAARPGQYLPIPPVDFVVLPAWRTLRPFGLQSPQQFRVAPPPALDSPAYTEAFNEVKRVGAKGGVARSAEESAYATFWMEFSEAGWNRIARTVAVERKLGLQATARLFALLNVALSDAYVAGWDSKFHYEFWRPTTAIQAASSDGNPATIADSAWQSAEPTPPVQDYPSTHSALGDAGAQVLAHVFGDATPFSFTSPSAGPAAPARSFASFSQAADENADSRVKGGLHFRFSCQAGQALGRQVGSWVVATALRPVPGSMAAR
jgi:hypothetical protein